jgi:hypothetical protein
MQDKMGNKMKRPVARIQEEEVELGEIKDLAEVITLSLVIYVEYKVTRHWDVQRSRIQEE